MRYLLVFVVLTAGCGDPLAPSPWSSSPPGFAVPAAPPAPCPAGSPFLYCPSQAVAPH